MGKKWTGMVLTGMIALTAVMSGCSGNGNSGAEPSASQPSSSASPSSNGEGDTEGYSLPIVEPGSVTLSFATYDNWYTPKSYAQNLPVWQEVENRTGVKINWDVMPIAQYSSAMNVRLAAASDLPDIINLPENPVKYGTDGVIVPLDELIENHAPNISRFLEENPEIHKMLKAPDGHIYALSSVTSGASYTDPYGLLLRKDWLDELELKEPNTLDEWYNVLKAFKEQDPNGNGLPDEIPLSPHYSWMGLGLFGNALGLNLTFYGFGYSIDDNGKVQYDWLNPKAEELIVWLNKLYSEGLLDAEFMTKKDDKILSDISLELIGSTNHFLNATGKFNKAIASGQAEWISALPPGSNGQPGSYDMYGPVSGFYAISKDSKNPEVAIKWLDFIYASEEGARLSAIGVEGLSYDMVDGKPQFTDFIVNNPDGLDAANALRSIGAFPVTPWIRADYGVYYEQPSMLLEMEPALISQAERLKPYLRDMPPIEFILPTKEESEALSRLSGNISTYQEETIVKYIVGREPIEWDKFTAKLKELGIEEMLQIKQEQYDRFNQ